MLLAYIVLSLILLKYQLVVVEGDDANLKDLLVPCVLVVTATCSFNSQKSWTLLQVYPECQKQYSTVSERGELYHSDGEGSNQCPNGCHVWNTSQKCSELYSRSCGHEMVKGSLSWQLHLVGTYLANVSTRCSGGGLEHLHVVETLVREVLTKWSCQEREPFDHFVLHL